jgi:hypothetical protein
MLQPQWTQNVSREKKKLKKFQILFQVPRDPCIAVGDDGYVAAPPGLKCFKEKINKNK